MKVFYAAAYQGNAEFGKFYKEIYDTVEKLGFHHLDNDVVTMTHEAFVQLMDKGGREAYIQNHDRKVKGIQEADICIFETSFPTLGLGYVVQKSLELNKPTIILYYKDHTPYFLSGISEDRLILKSYTEKTLKKIVTDALEVAKERRDKRFNFFISPKLLDYIEKKSKEEGITKSMFIRNLILNRMHRKEPEPLS